MESGVIFPRTHVYTVSTPIYQGPLDLLLQLIERAELDITRLALAQVTDQYLEYIHNMPELSAQDVSAFLVVAAKLIQIKSEALLPRRYNFFINCILLHLIDGIGYRLDRHPLFSV
jgi:hypothetical protein